MAVELFGVLVWLSGPAVAQGFPHACFPGGSTLVAHGRAGLVGPSVMEEMLACPTEPLRDATRVPPGDSVEIAKGAFSYSGAPAYEVRAGRVHPLGTVVAPTSGPDLLSRRVEVPDEEIGAVDLVDMLLNQVAEEASVFVPWDSTPRSGGPKIRREGRAGQTLGDVLQELASEMNVHIRLLVQPMPEGMKYRYRVDTYYPTLQESVTTPL